MCGISGRFNLDGRPVAADEILAMRDIMHHRGPDDAGLFVEGPIGLGHRRLSIIDLSGGQQPISNEDGTVTVVFNGEIYNYRELRTDLIRRGHTLKTHTDTEVIVHLYEDFGPECVQQLRGMFAFALWDARQRKLLLVRDRLGIKPLYYAETANSILFASEIKAIIQADRSLAEPDPIGLRRYLTYRHAYGHGTVFKKIRQLPPAMYLSVDSRGIRLHRYWDVPVCDGGRRVRSGDKFIRLLDEAVELRMISDVPIGAFLSGGIDSSLVTALMARHTDHVRTFSIGFVPGEENELSWARRVAAGCAAEHHEFTQRAEDFFSLLQNLIWHHDEPLAFPASIPLYLLSRESKHTATVMLAGEGADELLAGYGNNVRSYWLQRVATVLPGALLRSVAGLPLPARLSAIAGRAALDPVELIMGSFRLPGHMGLTGACRIDLPRGDDDDRALAEEVGLLTREGSFLDRLLYFQLKTYLIALLMKQDKMSMAASIETRVPYLDHHLVELAFSLPDGAKVRGRTGKYLLKEVSGRFLPRDVIHRPKQGFPVPIADWFREPSNQFIDLLLDSESLRDGLLEPRYVKSRVARFLQGERNSLEIWAMLNLELWRRNFLVGSNKRTHRQTAIS